MITLGIIAIVVLTLWACAVLAYSVSILAIWLECKTLSCSCVVLPQRFVDADGTPFPFTLAGYLMAESAPGRLLRFSRAAVGWLPVGWYARDGMCAGFTAFTGASGVTIVALGGLLLPALLKDGYPDRFALGLLTSGGSRGILFPPSLPLIVYAMIAGLTMQSMPADFGGSLDEPEAIVETVGAPVDSAQAALDDELDRLMAEDDDLDDEAGVAADEEGVEVAAEDGTVTPEEGVEVAADSAAAEDGEIDGSGEPEGAAVAAEEDIDEDDELLAELGIDDVEAAAMASVGDVGGDDDGDGGSGVAVAAPEPVMQVSVDRLFVAGAIPGIVSVLLVALYSLYFGIRHKVPRFKFSWKELGLATKDMIWEIPIPLIVIIGIYGGFFTAIDGAAIVAAYTLIVEVFIYKDIKFSRLPRIFRDAMVLVGGILLILMSATALTNFFIDREVPQKLFELVRSNISSPLTFLIVLNIFLLAKLVWMIYSATWLCADHHPSGL